jgi:hypothetical protein
LLDKDTDDLQTVQVFEDFARAIASESRDGSAGLQLHTRKVK